MFSYFYTILDSTSMCINQLLVYIKLLSYIQSVWFIITFMSSELIIKIITFSSFIFKYFS